MNIPLSLRLFSNIQVSEHKIKGKSITVKKADVKPGKVIINHLEWALLSFFILGSTFRCMWVNCLKQGVKRKTSRSILPRFVSLIESVRDFP